MKLFFEVKVRVFEEGEKAQAATWSIIIDGLQMIIWSFVGSSHTRNPTVGCWLSGPARECWGLLLGRSTWLQLTIMGVLITSHWFSISFNVVPSGLHGNLPVGRRGNPSPEDSAGPSLLKGRHHFSKCLNPFFPFLKAQCSDQEVPPWSYDYEVIFPLWVIPKVLHQGALVQLYHPLRLLYLWYHLE